MQNRAKSRSYNALSRAIEPLENRLLMAADRMVSTVRWDGHDYQAVAGEYIVDFKSGADVNAMIAKAGFEDVHSLGGDGAFRVSSALTPNQIRQWARRNSRNLDQVLPNIAGEYTRAPNESTTAGAFYNGQYHLNNTGQAIPDPAVGQNPLTIPFRGAGTPGADIDAQKAWDITTGSPDVVIAIMDSGIDVNHPDLAPNLYVNPNEIPGNGIDDDVNGVIDDINGYDFFDDTNVLTDNVGHGTFSAGVAAARGDNGIGVAGVSWDSKILTIKIGDDNPTLDAAITGTNYITQLKQAGANIVAANASFNLGVFPFSKAYFRAISRMGDADVLLIAAAGNAKLNLAPIQDFPAKFSLSLSNVITVGATDQNDNLATFSNFGVGVNIAAPGVSILSTTPTYTGTTFSDDGIPLNYGYSDGTSFSSPMVAGVAALAKSANPSATAAQIKAALLNGADQLPSLQNQYNTAKPVSTGGRVNAYNTVRQIRNFYASTSTVRQGSWKGAYGTDGQFIVGDSVSFPSFVDANVDGLTFKVVEDRTNSPIALQRVDPLAEDRIEAYIGNPNTFDLSLAFNDGKAHQVSLYFADYEKLGRVQNVQIVDTASGTVLNTNQISKFNDGRYLTYTLSGAVTIRVTSLNAGASPVLSALFFDPTPTNDGAFVRQDTATRGKWIGTYGSEGYYVVGGGKFSLPADSVQFSTAGATEESIAPVTTSASALQNPSNPSKGVVSYLSGSAFDVNLNFTDTLTRRVSFYMVDFDKQKRTQRIDVFNADTGNLVATQEVSAFTKGTYVSFDLRGNVRVRFTALGGLNAVLSGTFIDGTPGTAVAFVGTDSKTSGSWAGKYGASGAFVVGSSTTSPGFLVTGIPESFVPAVSTNLIKLHSKSKAAAQVPGNRHDRVSAYYFSVGTMTLNLTPIDNVTTGRVTLYFADLDNQKRAQTVTFLSNGKKLASTEVRNFKNGLYVTYDLTGPIQIQISRISGPNVVLSAIFFD